MRPQLRCSIIGAIRIDGYSGAVREIVILAPGYYFPIEQLASGATPPPGRAWIRHENCACYEIAKHTLDEASTRSGRLAAAA